MADRTAVTPTWQPRYNVQKAEGVGGPPIPADEPCLVIRAQDYLALAVLNDYLLRYGELPSADPAVTEELHRHRDALVLWQRTHLVKVADR